MDSMNRSGVLMNAMRIKGRQVRMAIVCLLAGAIPVAAQVAPDYSGFSASQFIPYANQQSLPFTDTPMLSFSVEGGEVRTVKMDTGSVGIVMSYDQINNYQQLKINPAAKPGYQFLSSSKILWKGTWVPATVTFYSGSTEVATATVPVLGVEQQGVCPGYKGDGDCPPPAQMLSAAGKGILYMGVGFGQEADYQPQGTPDKNPLLNLTSLAGQPVAAGTFNPGYIVGSTGVTVGLTPANTTGFGFIKLTPYAQFPGDWMPAGMCVQINGSNCFCGTVLVDTGIAQSYITVPSSVKYQTVKQKDVSTSQYIQVLAPGTTVVVNLPGLPTPVTVDSFTVGQNEPQEPLQVIPWPSDVKQPFVNTGRHFLRKYQFLYDAGNGYVGLKLQADGNGG